MPFCSITSNELSCGALNSWTTCSVTYGGVPISSVVPPAATGLLLRVASTDPAIKFIGFRAVGGSSAGAREIGANGHNMAVVKLDSNKHFQYYKQSSLIKVYLEGYCHSSDVVLFTTPVNKTPATLDAWTDVDVSTECPSALAVIFELNRVTGWFAGIRKKGSTDDYRGRAFHHIWGMIGVEDSQVFEFFNDTFGGAYATLHILGYITGNTTFLTNAEDITPSATGSWEDKDLDKSNCDIAIVMAYDPNYEYGLREDGSSAERRGHTEGIGFLHVKVASNGYIETWRYYNDREMYLVGWLLSSYKYPSDAITRATGIRHVYRPGSYRLEANLGEVSNTIEVVRQEVVMPPPFNYEQQYIIDRMSAEVARTVEVPAKTAPELIRALEDEGLWPVSAKVTMPQPPPERIKPVPEPAPEPTPIEYTYEQQYLIEQERLRQQQRQQVGYKGFIDWRKITPWVEEKGETLGSEVEERWKSFTGWLGGMFR